jgi:hypothetical protein
VTGSESPIASGATADASGIGGFRPTRMAVELSVRIMGFGVAVSVHRTSGRVSLRLTAPKWRTGPGIGARPVRPLAAIGVAIGARRAIVPPDPMEPR